MTGSVLVSGGAGFIGRRLARRLLDAGRTVTVLDSLLASVHGSHPSVPDELDGARFVKADVRDAAAWRDALAGADLVYHLAAETGTGESMYRAHHYVDVNVNGTRRLCDVVAAADARPKRVVVASSRAIYGEGPYRCATHDVVHPTPRSAERLARGQWEPVCPRCGCDVEAMAAGPSTEAHPASVYGETKRDQEAILLEALPPLGLEAVSLRLQNVYGPGQSVRNPYTGILSIFTVRLLDGERVSIFEDGRETRDFVHVDDVVEALARAGEVVLPSPTLVADVGSGRPTSVLEAARVLARACGVEDTLLTVTGEYRIGDIRHAFCDPAPLRAALGVAARTPLEDGIRGLVAWVRTAERPESRLDAALDEMRAAGLLGRRALRVTEAAPRAPVVFLGLPMAINVRDVLRTDAFRTLRDAGAEIHLFTPAADVPEFRAEFAAPSVHIHPLAAPRSLAFESWDAAVLKLHVLLLSLRCDTARIMVEPTLARSFPARIVRNALHTLGRNGQNVLLRVTRAVTVHGGPELYEEAFRRYRPDLVVGTRVITMSGPRTHSSPRYLDRHLLMSAARRGVPTMVLVSSWDNLTTSGFFPVDVDRITVWNEIMREQAVAIHGVPRERVVVTGAPQHDVFAHAAPFQERAAFLRALGLDPERRVVVYTTGTEGTIPQEPELVAVIARALEAELEGVQLLVRLHQLDRMDRYATLRTNPRVAFDQAGRPPLGAYHDRDFDRGQHERLADTLRHADVVVNAASSISIDAAAVGTPVVCVDFDARPGTPYHASVSRFYDFTHQRPVVESGGVARARSPEALVAAIRRYLEDPTLDGEGRVRLVREQCAVIDGRAGERVGRAMLELLASASR